VGYGGGGVARCGAAGQKRASGLITLLLGGSARSCLNRAPVSRGLGLITPAKVTPTTLPNHLLLRVSQAFWRNIHIAGRRGYRKKNEIKIEDRCGKEEQTEL